MIENLQFSSLIKEMPFPFNCMPYLDSNIPFNIFYASVGSEILCIARTTTDLINTVTRVNPFLIQMKKQGSECVHSILLSILFYYTVFRKFADTANQFIRLLSL